MESLNEPGAADTARRRLPRDAGLVSQLREQLGPTTAYGALNGLREVICEPSRLMIIAALRLGELSAGALAIIIDRRPPTTSQHLRMLRELGLVVSTRRHRVVHYRLDSGPGVSLVLSIIQLLLITA